MLFGWIIYLKIFEGIFSLRRVVLNDAELLLIVESSSLGRVETFNVYSEH
jgi:hypothetical protein